MYTKYKQDIKCPFCGKTMILDDIGYNFDGNEDQYYVCDNHDVTATVRIRYKKAVIIKIYKGGQLFSINGREV